MSEWFNVTLRQPVMLLCEPRTSSTPDNDKTTLDKTTASSQNNNTHISASFNQFTSSYTVYTTSQRWDGNTGNEYLNTSRLNNAPTSPSVYKLT